MTRAEELRSAVEKFLKTKDWSKRYIEGEVTSEARAFWEGRKAITAQPRRFSQAQVLPPIKRQFATQIKHQ
jgi:hypothetical protein